MYLSICVSTYLSMYLSIYISNYLPIYLCTYLCIYLTIYLSIYLSMYLCIPMHLFNYISIAADGLKGRVFEVSLIELKNNEDHAPCTINLRAEDV